MNYIGIDGGGTKTKFTLVNEDLVQLDTYITTTCHFAQVGYDGLKQVLEEGIQYFVQKYSLTEYGIGFGLAGYGREQSIRNKIEEIVKIVSEEHSYVLVNDVQSAMAGALDLQDGITVIAGTGSIAYAKKGDELVRSGGWGYFLGDEGSGTWLGERVLQIFTKQADGRLSKGALYDLMMQKCNLENDYDIISYVRDHILGDRSEIASFARLAYEGAQAKDETMIDLYKEAAKEIALMINTLHRDVFASTPTFLSYIGGVFTAQEFILSPLRSYIDANVTIQTPVNEPDIGVIKLLIEYLEK